MSEQLEADKLLAKKKEQTLGAIFLASVTGASILGGFGYAFTAAKKRDPRYFAKGLTPSGHLRESGAQLAVRALGWGSLYAVTGVAGFTWIVWKLLRVNSFQELRDKCESFFPRAPRNEPPLTRTEFDSFRDLFNYIIEEDQKRKVVKSTETTEKTSSDG